MERSFFFPWFLPLLCLTGNLTQTLSFLGFKDLIDLLNSVQSGALTQQLDSMSGLTLFVPIPSAIQSFRNAIVPNGNFDNQSGNGKVSPDQVATILGQHVIQGRVLYSPLLADQGSIITSSGQDLSFDKRSLTVRVGDQSARVVQSVSDENVGYTTLRDVRRSLLKLQSFLFLSLARSQDIMMRTGVIHLIDKVLINTNLDSARGQQAARSAQAVVPHTVSGPISATNAATSAGDQVPGPNANNGGSSNRNDSSWGYHPGNGNGNGNGNGKNGAGVSLTKGATSASAIGFATLAGLAVLAF